MSGVIARRAADQGISHGAIETDDYIDVMFTGADETHLYLLSLAALAAADRRDAAMALLSVAERQVYERIKVAGRRTEYLLGRYATKTILARYLTVPVGKLVIEPDARGKLRIARPHVPAGPGFNLSHSADLLAIAMSPREEVGVDVEKVNDGLSGELDAIASRHFCPAEQRALAHGHPGRRLDEFFRMWTLKEAALKAVGAGLQLPLKAVDVAVAAARYVIPWPGGESRTGSIEACHWDDLASGYHVAVARLGVLGTVRVFHAM